MVWDLHEQCLHEGSEGQDLTLAVGADPRDCWAHHAVAHVMEMEGRPADGLAWINAREANWADESNFLKVHNWWHRALCHIELRDPAAALALYDGPIGAGATAMDLVDASALLWRLDLMGVDVGNRFETLSKRREGLSDGHLYPFNDFHAAMAHLGAGRQDEVDSLLAHMAVTGGNETAGWIERTGRPLVEGLTAFRRGDHAAAAERLWTARHIANMFGGSHWRGRHGGRPGSWLSRMLARKPRKLVAIALANKMARMVWAMLAGETDYRDPTGAIC